MRWCAAPFEQAFDALSQVLRATPWPGPPPGFTHATPPRRMRVVLRGRLASPEGHVPVIVKWSRPDRFPDRVSRHVRGGKGVREGRTLRALADAGVAAPTALAFRDDIVDVLVTREIADLAPLPHADAATAAQVRAVAGLVAAAHDAGLRHRDLHAGNVGWADGSPLLVDLGGARVGAPLDAAERLRALAHARHALLGPARRAQRLRASIAYFEAAGEPAPRSRAKETAGTLEADARAVAARYRRRRDRRATRRGRHFAPFRGAEGAHGIRWRDGTDERWEARARAWLASWPAEATSLKAGGGVVRLPAPDGSGAIVLKRYDGLAQGRVPRPQRAFRRAYALQNRGIAVPQPLLAIARRDGSGIYAAAWMDAPDLHAFTDGGAGGAYAALPFAQRRALLVRLGRTLRAMHDGDVSHRDLKAPNLLVAGRDGEPLVAIADLEGARIRRRPVSWKRRARDLARLDASLGARATDRLRVLRAYVGVLPRPPHSERAIAARIARHVRRKRGPSGLPR